MELLSLDSDIAEKAIIDGSFCIPQPRLARFSILLVALFGKLMFSKPACKLQLSMMNKIYPQLAYPDEIKNYYMEDMPRTPIKTLVTIYKTYMGHYKLNSRISKSKAQVLYIYGEKELNGVKESARLFQQLHPNTILYEAKGYNHGLIYQLPTSRVGLNLVVPFLENNKLTYTQKPPHKLQLVGHFLILFFHLQITSVFSTL